MYSLLYFFFFQLNMPCKVKVKFLMDFLTRLFSCSLVTICHFISAKFSAPLFLTGDWRELVCAFIEIAYIYPFALSRLNLIPRGETISLPYMFLTRIIELDKVYFSANKQSRDLSRKCFHNCIEMRVNTFLDRTTFNLLN